MFLKRSPPNADTAAVILVVAFALGLLTVPLAGGRLRLLGDLRLRRSWLLAVAFFLQLIALKAPLAHDAAAALNIATYLLGCWYLVANLEIAGLWLVGLGAGANMLALFANGGVMPASEKALATAGLSTGSSGFVNSTAVADARVAFLGDVFATPASWPLSNVFSIGDVFIVLGGLVAAHRLCGSRVGPDRPWLLPSSTRGKHQEPDQTQQTERGATPAQQGRPLGAAHAGQDRRERR